MAKGWKSWNLHLSLSLCGLCSTVASRQLDSLIWWLRAPKTCAWRGRAGQKLCSFFYDLASCYPVSLLLHSSSQFERSAQGQGQRQRPTPQWREECFHHSINKSIMWDGRETQFVANTRPCGYVCFSLFCFKEYVILVCKMRILAWLDALQLPSNFNIL